MKLLKSILIFLAVILSLFLTVVLVREREGFYIILVVVSLIINIIVFVLDND